MKNTQLNAVGAQAGAVVPEASWLGGLDRLLGFLGLGRSPARARPARQEFPFERAFVDERSANAFAVQMREQGYHAEVHQCDYDYSWSVEVFEAAPDDAAGH